MNTHGQAPVVALKKFWPLELALTSCGLHVFQSLRFSHTMVRVHRGISDEDSEFLSRCNAQLQRSNSTY
jgi:hypothetical protein